MTDTTSDTLRCQRRRRRQQQQKRQGQQQYHYALMTMATVAFVLISVELSGTLLEERYSNRQGFASAVTAFQSPGVISSVTRHFHATKNTGSTDLFSALFKSSKPTPISSFHESCGAPLSAPPLQMKSEASCEAEQREFEMHVGHALDVLRDDYAIILSEQPDFSIYDRNVEVIDPSGVKMHGVQSYRHAFALLHAVVRVFYCPSRSKMQFRMCFDKARRNIRIHWNAAVVPREIFGGSRTTAYMDGISVYELDRKTGLITQHRIEQLLLNNMPLKPREGVFAALADQHAVSVASYFKEQGIGNSTSSNSPMDYPNQVLPFQAPNPFQRQPSLLFTVETGSDRSASASRKDDPYPELDWEAFERKNKSRKNFGLKPLSPEEFLEIQSQVKQLEMQQKQKAAAAAAAAEMSREQEKQESFIERLLSGVLQDTCESNFDCQRPEVCCDFGFKKQCCSAGLFVGKSAYSREGELAWVPVPVEIPPENRGPPQRY